MPQKPNARITAFRQPERILWESNPFVNLLLLAVDHVPPDPNIAD